MINKNTRIPEGEAILNTPSLSMEEYSKIMYKRLAKDYLRFANNVISGTGPVQNGSVMEIGTGPGWGGISLLQCRTDLTLTAIEASADMAKVATQNALEAGVASRFTCKTGYAENMAIFKDNTFDVVISRDSLHHWDNPAQVFAEIQRVLKNDGKVFISDSRRDISLGANMIVEIFGATMPKGMGKHWKASIQASYTKKEIETILSTSLPECTVSEGFLDLSIVK